MFPRSPCGPNVKERLETGWRWVTTEDPANGNRPGARKELSAKHINNQRSSGGCPPTVSRGPWVLLHTYVKEPGGYSFPVPCLDKALPSAAWRPFWANDATNGTCYGLDRHCACQEQRASSSPHVLISVQLCYPRLQRIFSLVCCCQGICASIEFALSAALSRNQPSPLSSFTGQTPFSLHILVPT
jgi:hypothetical protein